MDFKSVTKLINTIGQIEKSNVPDNTKKWLLRIVLAGLAFWQAPKVYDAGKETWENWKKIKLSNPTPMQRIFLVALASGITSASLVLECNIRA